MPETCYYDYDNQAWVVNGRYKRCEHPDSMDCRCYSKVHDGELANDEIRAEYGD